MAATVEAVSDAQLLREPVSRSAREETAVWIARRRGVDGSYADMFAPTPKDFRNAVTLVTGERLTTAASKAHILGEEACRALITLGIRRQAVNQALQQATQGMMSRLRTLDKPRAPSGFYCCGKCSVALWRHLAAGGLDRPEDRLVAGLRTLKSHRDGKGRWGRFPFWYALLALTEIELKPAIAEARYAAPTCERFLERTSQDRIAQRRRIIAERVLAKC